VKKADDKKRRSAIAEKETDVEANSDREAHWRKKRQMARDKRR
jgi:hypothetical protein